VTHTIFRVTVVQPPAQPARRMQESRPDVIGDGSDGMTPGATTTSSGGGGATATAAGAAGASAAGARAAKIGRNDPCWCGSGKKYKKCHGA
jgi:preprotein translocase subunit SecA